MPSILNPEDFPSSIKKDLIHNSIAFTFGWLIFWQGLAYNLTDMVLNVISVVNLQQLNLVYAIDLILFGSFFFFFCFFWQFLCYFLLTLGLELLPLHKLTAITVKEWWMKCWRNNLINLKAETSSPSLEPFLAPSSNYVIPDFDLDVDVAAERNRVLSGSIDNAIIYLSNLRKVPSLFYSNYDRIFVVRIFLSWSLVFCTKLQWCIVLD